MDSYKRPLVSICIPTLNGEKHLLEALSSINKQTYKNIEVIISDDGSTDSTLAICEKFKLTCKFPIDIYHHKSAGIGANWNNSIKYASGEYIKFLFQDDVLFPSCVEKLIEGFSGKDEVGLVASKRKILLENPENNWQLSWFNKYADLQNKLELPTNNINYLSKEILRHPNFVNDPFNKIGEPTAVLFRKSILDQIGLFREDLKIVLDIEFYYRVLKNYEIGILNQELVGFRIHEDQTSKKEKYTHNQDREIFFKILFRDFFWFLNFRTRKFLVLYFLTNAKKKMLKLKNSF